MPWRHALRSRLEAGDVGGLSPFVLDRLIGIVAQDRDIERALIYGSRARGDWRAGSDIDLAIDGAVVDSRMVSRLKDRHDASVIVHALDVTALPTLAADHLLRTRIERDGIEIYNRVNLSPSTRR